MRLGRIATAFAALLAAVPGNAAEYPSRPITLVVPYAAGGGNDVIARIVAERMGASLGQSIVIENRGGAGGTIATRQVAKAEPDGYTLLIATSSNVVLVHPDVPVRSIASLVLLAKDKPGQLTFASTGTGSSVHLAAELFAGMAGIKLNHVPYKGSAPALNDLIGGHVAMMFSTMASAVGLVHENNKVRALAVTGAMRSPLFPDLPTVAEAGLPGYEAVLHYGVVAPAGTPRPVVDKLNAALNTALANDEVKRRLAVEGAEALPVSPDEYAKDIAKEESKWSEIIRKSGMKAE